MEVKHPGCSTWTDKNIILYPNTLFFYSFDNNVQAEGVLDFNLISAIIKVKTEDTKIFEILIFKLSCTFCFRCPDKDTAKEWLKAINYQITTSKGYQKSLTKVSLQPGFWKFDRISEKDLIENSMVGDIVLFRAYGFIPAVQRFFTCSRTGIYFVNCRSCWYDY